MLIVRFRMYAPDGASLGILPHPLSWEAGLPLNDMSSLTMTYPDGSDAANLLRAPCEVALELRNPDTGVFTEYGGCRFINIKTSVDMAARPRVLSFTMPSYGWMLKKVRWMDPNFSRLNKDNQIVYKTAVSPALPIKEILDNAQGRSNVPNLAHNFTNSIDSLGAAWTISIKGASFDFGQDAWSMIDTFSRQGFFDWRMNGREVELYKTDTFLRRILDTDTGVHLHSRVAMSEEPVERTWEDLAGQIVALGDTTVSALVEAPDSIYYPWGKWDEAVTASGVDDYQTLSDITDRLLLTKYKSRSQYTKSLVWTEGAPIPLATYRPGDFIRATSDAVTGSQKASMRIYQITLTGVDPYGVAITLTLNDRFTDRALQVDRWVARSSGSGGSVGGGGTGGGTTKPQPPPVDSKPPQAPILNGVTNAPYFSTLGDPVSEADAAFQVVTLDTNGRSIDIKHYNVSARRSDLNDQQARVVQVAQPDSPSTGQVIHAKVPLLDSGFTYFFRVQAVRSSGYVSDWSNTIGQAMAYTTTAPPIPSAPILSSKLSTVKAEWNGLDNTLPTGAAYPASFREIQVEVSINNTTWFHVGDIFAGGSALIMSGKGVAPTWNVGDTVYVRFKARNSASVVSAASTVTSIVVLGVIGADIAANTITANNIVVGTITAELIKAHSLTVDRLSVGNPNNLFIDPALTSADLTAWRLAMAVSSSAATTAWTIASGGIIRLDNNGTANSLSRFGLVNNTTLTFPLQTFPGPTLTSVEQVIPITRPGGTDGTATGNVKARFTVTATGVPASPGASTINVSVLVRQFRRDGTSYTVSGTSVSDYAITANGTYTTQSTTGYVVPADVVGIIPYLYVRLDGGVSVDVALQFSNIEVWQENSVYIGDGLIKAPLIAADAVTTVKLSADAITAKHSIRSAYYEMVSTSGGVTIKITENANFVGQSGIRWDGLIPSGGTGPRIFQTDASGTGGWDARGLAIVGPETTTNSSGRVDFQLAYGIAGTKMARSYGSETISEQGIYWDTATARFRIGGMFNTGYYSNDMFRLGRLSSQNGTMSYGITTTRRYYPFLVPNGGSTAVTSSIYQFPSGTEAGFQWVSSAGTTEVFWLAVCGTP